MLPILLAALLPVFAHSHPKQIEDVVKRVKQECKDADNGTVDVGPGAVKAEDLNGDGKPDYLVDYTQLMCSTMASLYSGSAGTLLEIYLTDAKGELVLAWQENVFQFELVTVKGKKELHVDGKGEEGAEVVADAYVAEGTKFVLRKTPPKDDGKKKPAR